MEQRKPYGERRVERQGPDRGAGRMSTDPPHDERLHHPIRAAEHEVEHLHEIADEGESPATPAITAAGVFVFVVPIVVVVMLLVLGVAHFA